MSGMASLFKLNAMHGLCVFRMFGWILRRELLWDVSLC